MYNIGRDCADTIVYVAITTLFTNCYIANSMNERTLHSKRYVASRLADSEYTDEPTNQQATMTSGALARRIKDYI